MSTTAERRERRSPQIALFHGLDLSPVEIAALTAANSSVDPETSWREALLAYRLFAMRRARDELLNATVVNETVIRQVLDAAWQVYFPVFRRATGPMIAEAYIRAFRNVEQGNVPIQLIYTLANEHADRVGVYFNDTSNDAMVQGFNTFVNRQVPQRAAIERVIDAYGLSPRQMSGYTSAAQLYPSKMETSTPKGVKAKIKSYIGKSIADRLNVFKRQEAHNLDMQAQQVAWMWLVENNKLPGTAEKMWLTAADEKVCKICGPMNKKKVAVNARFELPNGNRLYVPGAHVNCRCQVRLQVNPFTVSKANDWDADEHPRGGNPANRGQFSRKPGPPKVETKVREKVDSPFLEEVMRGVEEVTREKPKLNISDPKPSLRISPPALRPSEPLAKPSLGVTPSTPSEPAQPEAKPALRISEPAPQEKPKLEISTEPKPALQVVRPKLDIDYEGLERLRDERQRAFQAHEMLPQRTTYRPTRQIVDEGDRPATGYRVTSQKNLGTFGDQLQLSEDDHVYLLTTDLRTKWIADQVTAMRDQEVFSAVEEVRGRFAVGRNRDGSEFVILTDETDIVPPVDEDGNDLPSEYLETINIRAEIPIEDVYSIVRESMWAHPGYGARNQDALGRLKYKLEWEDDEGDKIQGDYLSAAEMAEQLGLIADQYRPVVARIDEGYNTAVPIDDETWSTPGTYTVANETRKFIENDHGELVPYTEVTLRPQVREETRVRYESPDETE